MNEFMKCACNKAQDGILKKEGGPFAAVIVKNNEVIATSNNTVLKDKDPTAHAEVNAIREACKKLGTHDLSECILYATTEPCPMCISAIIWANIKEVYYGTDRKDVEKIGFRDNKIYDFLSSKENLIKKEQLNKEECKRVLDLYDDVIY